MALHLCSCGLAMHFISVAAGIEGPVYTAYLCEHCDDYCSGCQWCTNLSRSEATKNRDRGG